MVLGISYHYLWVCNGRDIEVFYYKGLYVESLIPTWWHFGELCHDGIVE